MKTKNATKSILAIKKIQNLYKKHLPFRAFIFLLIMGFAIGIAQVIRSYIINVRYTNPSPLMSARILFEYTAFSYIAFLFPFSWKKAKGNKPVTIAIIILTSLFFVIIYLFVLSSLEWSASKKNYNLWNGYVFTLYHSGLFTIIIYSIIAGILYLFGITKVSKKLEPEYLKRIPFKVNNKTSFISVDEIQFLEANDNYVSIYSDDDKHHLVRKTLSKFEKQLDSKLFQRIHRKYIINIGKVDSWKADPNGGYIIYLANRRSVKMSKSYREKIKLFSKN